MNANVTLTVKDLINVTYHRIYIEPTLSTRATYMTKVEGFQMEPLVQIIK